MKFKKERKPVRLGSRFKNSFEEKLYKSLPKKRTTYEGMKIKYALARTYIPDFVVERTDGSTLIIEAKGYLRPSDRSKMIAVKERNPTLDIRIVFAYDNKLNKNSNTRYTEWAKKNGFPCAVGKVPPNWLYTPTYDPAYAKAYYERNKSRIIDRAWRHKLKKYGLTEKRYNEIVQEQHNSCAICGVDFSSLPRKPDVDHCHETGLFRGLLCWHCNGGLGQYDNNPTLLRKAAKYLENFNERTKKKVST